VIGNKGSLSIEWIKEKTGTNRSSGVEATVPATIGSSVVKVNCKTSNTDLGTATGVFVRQDGD
jgi:hypothetical protein